MVWQLSNFEPTALSWEVLMLQQMDEEEELLQDGFYRMEAEEKEIDQAISKFLAEEFVYEKEKYERWLLHSILCSSYFSTWILSA